MALYRTFLRTVLTLQRLIGFAALVGIGAVIAYFLRPEEVGFFQVDTATPASLFIDNFGLMLAVPVSALVFASAAFGDLVEDQTLVYLWLRPIARWRLAVAAFAAAATVAAPVGLAGTVIGAAIIDPSTVRSAAVGAVIGSLAYVAIFLVVGLVTNRALIWGIGYLLIYEQFIARGGRSLGFLSVHAHIVSIMKNATPTTADFALAYFSTGTAVVAPLVLSGVMLAWLSSRLERSEVA